MPDQATMARGGWIRRPAVATQLLGASMIVAATFMPWVHSGQRAINAYEASALADRFDLISTSWQLRPLALVPLALSIGVLMRWLRQSLAAIAITSSTALYCTVVGAAAWFAVGATRGHGVTLTVIASVTVLVACVVEVHTRRSLRTNSPTPNQSLS